MEEFLQSIAPTTISLIITGIVSLAIGIYLEKFKNRLTFIKYRIFFQPLATSNENEYWGNIEVYYNGSKSNHLNFATIELINDSNKDFQDVIIDVWVDKDTFIKGQNGFYSDTGKSILMENNHYIGLTETIKQNSEDISKRQKNPNHITPVKLQNDIVYYQSNVKFHLPVFNRKSDIKFNILVGNEKANQPIFGIDIKHKGLKVIKQDDKYDEERKLGIGTITFGTLFFVLITIIIYFKFPNSLIPTIILGIAGVLHLVVGTFIYKLIQFIRNYLK